MTPSQLIMVQGNSVGSEIIVDETELFLADMLALFRRERHGHVGRWQYSDNEGPNDPVKGALLWQAFLRASKKYYPLHNEVKLIHDKAGLLLGERPDPTLLVDFGPGPAQAVRLKTLPVKWHFKNVKGYCPIDLSRTFLIEAAKEVDADQPGIPIHAFHSDYFEDDIKLPENGVTPFGLFFGSTISNFEGRPEDGIPEDKIVYQLSRLRQILQDNGELMFAYDANQEESSILESYMHALQMEFGRNIMHRVVRDLPVMGDFDPNAWRYEAVWHEKTHQLCHTVVCERNMDFFLGTERFRLREGERFILNNSFKYPVPKMREWGQQAGWGTQRHAMDSQNRVALQLMAA